MTTENVIATQEFSNTTKVKICWNCHKPAYTIVTQGEDIKIYPAKSNQATMNFKAGSAINLGSILCPYCKAKNKLNLGGKEMVTENKPVRAPFDPNAGKRASLEAQIKAWTGVAANMQTQLNSMNARIAAAQAELNALPPAPQAPVTPPAK
jgi:hypothetical protein